VLLGPGVSFLRGLGSSHLSRRDAAVKLVRGNARKNARAECGARADKRARQTFSIVPGSSIAMALWFLSSRRNLIIREPRQKGHGKLMAKESEREKEREREREFSFIQRQQRRWTHCASDLPLMRH